MVMNSKSLFKTIAQQTFVLYSRRILNESNNNILLLFVFEQIIILTLLSHIFCLITIRRFFCNAL